MTARNSSAFLLFALCLALAVAFTSCSPDDSTPRQDALSSAAAQKAYDEAKAKLVPQEDIDRAQTEFETAKKEADKAQAKADGMSKATRRSNKDPNNPQQAPDTFKAIQAAKTARTSAQEKEQAHLNLVAKARQSRSDLDRAGAALAVAKEREANGPEKPKGPGELGAPQTDSSQYYISLLSSFVSVLTLILLIISLLLIRKGFSNFQIEAEKQFKVLLKRQEENLELLGALPGELTDPRTRLAGLQNDVKKLLEQTTLIELRQGEAEGGGARDYRPPYEPPIEEKATLTFPVSAGSILARLGGQEPTITLDALRNILVRDSDGKGELILIQDPNAPYGLNYIVPNTSRLGAREDFYNHYKQFYDCDIPKGGEVWVTRPALVARMGDGWQLEEKGTLEIR